MMDMEKENDMKKRSSILYQSSDISQVRCPKCCEILPQGAIYCAFCGKKLGEPERKHLKRANGTGSVFKTPSGKYKAVVTIGYVTGEDGKRHRRTRSMTCDRRKDAVAAIHALMGEKPDEKRRRMTFGALYNAWLPTHRAGKDTLNCYKAAWRYFDAVKDMRITDIDVDDLQECVDECPKGAATRRNMKTLAGLLYKYGIPRHVIPENLNLAPFLAVSGEAAAHRASFDDFQIEAIRKTVGAVPGADAILCMIYTGFRPSEFLALTGKSYDKRRSCITGGAKTAAGKGRAVTVSPKIKSLIPQNKAPNEPLFPDPHGRAWDLKDFTERLFYPALEQIGIDNPIVEVGGGVKRHKYTPHSCRHTFATLMKRVPGAEKDKLELIGHASGEMLRYYQDVDVADLRRITDAL